MKIVLVLTALEEELAAVLDLKPNGESDWERKRIAEGYTYFEARFSSPTNEPFIVRAACQPQQGMIFAVSHAGVFLRDNPEIVFMTGICAGNPDKGLHLGDVVISDMAFHYESGKQTSEGLWPDMECSIVPAVSLQLLNEFCRGSEGSLIRGDSQFEIFVGSFATGSAVVSRRGIFEQLAKRERNVLALDMEAYAVLKAVELKNRGITAIVIKGVCDFADEKKDDSAHVIAAKNSAFCMLRLAEFMIPNVVRAPRLSFGAVTYPIQLNRPALSIEDRKAWRMLLRWPDDETWAFQEGESWSGLEFYDLGGDRWLLEVTVEYGAYNGSYRYYYLDESGEVNNWKPVVFRDLWWDDNGEVYYHNTELISGNAWFDPEKSAIGTFYKGRGIGDCGSLVIYEFDRGETKLIEYRFRDSDFGVIDPDEIPPPDEWPLIDIKRDFQFKEPD